MKLLTTSLAQLLGLDTSTWVAIAAAIVATVGVGMNFWNVSRTLRHNRQNLAKTLAHAQEQAAIGAYNTARDTLMANLSRASLSMEDLEDAMRANYPADVVASAREVYAEVKGAYLAFASHAPPGDVTVVRAISAATSFELAISSVRDAWVLKTIDLQHARTQLAAATETFVRNMGQLENQRAPEQGESSRRRLASEHTRDQAAGEGDPERRGPRRQSF